LNGTFPDYLRTFFANYFGDVGYPEWCVNALRSVGVDLLEKSDIKVVPGCALHNTARSIVTDRTTGPVRNGNRINASA
jgi:hypothetical protein